MLYVGIKCSKHGLDYKWNVLALVRLERNKKDITRGGGILGYLCCLKFPLRKFNYVALTFLKDYKKTT